MAKTIPESKWKWYGHAAHLIVADSCRFHLCTVVGKFIISTVGDYYLNERDLKPKEIGCGRLFETFVFKAGRVCDEACKCPLGGGDELDTLGANDRATANANHLRMCKKYAKGTAHAPR